MLEALAIYCVPLGGTLLWTDALHPSKTSYDAALSLSMIAFGDGSIREVTDFG